MEMRKKATIGYWLLTLMWSASLAKALWGRDPKDCDRFGRQITAGSAYFSSAMLASSMISFEPRLRTDRRMAGVESQRSLLIRIGVSPLFGCGGVGVVRIRSDRARHRRLFSWWPMHTLGRDFICADEDEEAEEEEEAGDTVRVLLLSESFNFCAQIFMSMFFVFVTPSILGDAGTAGTTSEPCIVCVYVTLCMYIAHNRKGKGIIGTLRYIVLYNLVSRVTLNIIIII